MRFLAALLLLAASPAFAVNVQWAHPTQGVQDGNTVSISLSQIASTTIEWSNGATFGTVAGSQVVPAPATSVTLVDPSPGTSRCYRARTTMVAAVGGQTSAVSNVSCIAVPAGPIVPNPPTITVTLVGNSAWTCTDGSAVLSTHTRQDQAQESCTNYAMRNVGKEFQMRAAGVYRVVARF